MEQLRRDDLVPAAGDRVRSRSDRLARVEQEIRQAQAEALGRTGERLQGILEQCYPCPGAGTRPGPTNDRVNDRGRTP